MLRYFTFVFLWVACSLLAEDEMPPLKPRQPNWRPHVLENYPNGNPKAVIFYEPEEGPVKQINFYPNGHIEAEIDLIELDEGEIIFHGASASFHLNNAVAKRACYNKGQLEGTVKTFFPSGQLETSSSYLKGARQGSSEAFHPNGNKKEEATYEQGKLIGNLFTYHEDGSRASQIAYKNGLPHGNALEWYSKEENEGGLRASRNYVDGLLHGDGKSPAVMVYGADLNALEVQDFRNGRPYGLHLKYHPNGQVSYRVNYLNDLKEGKEEFFHEDGSIAGEGLYRQGVARGEHLLHFLEGQLRKRAYYDEKGKLIEPIVEYFENGRLKMSYTLDEEHYEGSYQTWYVSGQLKEDYRYVNGMLNGEQKEYYENGELKLSVCFEKKKLHGPYREWYEDGSPKVIKNYVQGEIDGEHLEWFANKQKRLEANYIRGKLTQTRREWREGGVLAFKGEYEEGVPHGSIEIWFPNGKRNQITYFDKGRRHGKEEKFYENGQRQNLAYFKEDLLDGEFHSWHPDGSVHTLMVYDNGIPVDEHREYYPPSKEGEAGQIARVFHYSNGNLDGEQLSFHPNGQIAATMSFHEGLLSGQKKQWEKEGCLIEEGNYVEGKLNGRYLQVGPEEEEVIFHYKDDQRCGIHQIFYPEHPTYGKVKRLNATFENDRLEGEVAEYSQKGTKMASTFYKKGLREGIATLYSEDEGMLMMSMEFHGDKREGKAISYYSDGKVYKEVSFSDDVRHGLTRTFHEDGSLATHYNYQNDQLDGLCQEWNKEGVLIFSGEYKDDLKHGKFNKYYDDGTPRLLCMYKEDKIVGEKKVFDLSGKQTH